MTAKSPTRDFSFPLQLGPGAPNPTNFKETRPPPTSSTGSTAFTTSIGISGSMKPAGNFQVNNFGRGGHRWRSDLCLQPVRDRAPGTALLDNSSFSFRNSTEDGFPGYVRMYLAGDHAMNIFADGSYDASVIIHEYTHGVSGRLGRDVYDTYQGRAMGEAWSDFFALEMLHPGRSRSGSQLRTWRVI